MTSYRKLGQFRSIESLAERLRELGLDLPLSDTILTAEAGSPLARPLSLGLSGGRQLIAGNRWCIHPMEGWDGTPDTPGYPWYARIRSVSFSRSNSPGAAAALVFLYPREMS